MLIQLVLGDWSNDGHGKTDSVFIESNLTAQQIQDAYVAAMNKLPALKCLNTLAEDYEDSELSNDHITALREAGYPIDKFVKEYEEGYGDDCTPSVDKESYTDIYLFIVLVGNPEFKHEVVSLDDINIGGYGLFY